MQGEVRHLCKDTARHSVYGDPTYRKDHHWFNDNTYGMSKDQRMEWLKRHWPEEYETRQDPQWKSKHHAASCKKAWESVEARKLRSELARQFWNDPECRRRHSEAAKLVSMQRRKNGMISGRKESRYEKMMASNAKTDAIDAQNALLADMLALKFPEV